LKIISGIVIIIFGLNFIGILNIGFLNREKRFEYKADSLKFVGSVIFGFVLRLGGRLYKLFFSFDSGFGGQFFHHAGGIDAACGVFPWAWDTFYCFGHDFESIREAFNFIKSNMRIINIISGILLILLGAAMLLT